MAFCVNVASTLLVAPAAAVSMSSSKSVSFNNGGLRTNSLATRRSSVRSLCVRADDSSKPNVENVVEKVKNAVSDLSQSIQEAIPNNQPEGSQAAKAAKGSPQDAIAYTQAPQPTVGSPGRKPGVGRQGQPEQKSSTGGITEAAKEMAEKTAAVFDGVKENIMDKLQDDGRDLKSKTGDVRYGSHRNADGIPSNVVEKTIQAQSEYTKNLGNKN